MTWFLERVKPIWWKKHFAPIPAEEIVIPKQEFEHVCHKYNICLPYRKITLDELEKLAEQNPHGEWARFLRILFWQQRMKPYDEYKKYAEWFMPYLPQKWKKEPERKIVGGIAAAIERMYWECRRDTGVWCGEERP